MKAHPLPLIAIILVLTCSAAAQQDSAYRLRLKGGSFVPKKNINSAFIGEFNRKTLRLQGQTFAIIQFEKIPTPGDRQQLLKSGVVLMDYIPNNTYMASVRGVLNEEILRQAKARAVIELKPEEKMAPTIANGIIPAWAIKRPGTVDVWVSFARTLAYDSVAKELKQRNFDIVSSGYKDYHITVLRIPLQRLEELASLSFIEFVQPAPHDDQPLNNITRADGRANMLNAPTMVGGRNLNGEGIVIGIGDISYVPNHVDFTNRLVNRTFAAPGSNDHGKHVSGIAAGAGILNELYRGYASKSTIISQYFSGIWLNAASYVQDYGMVLSNNSYGAIAGDCSYNGLYDLYSYILDQQAFDYPYLQQVFAAGNSGGLSCPPYPAGYKTVLGSYQSSKNVLVVGSTDSTGTIDGSSSKGPVQDGRLKPEIVSMGKRVISTGLGYYYTNSGTSMACPGVTGGLALLYQLYREKNSGSNPRNGLMKAVVCNSSRDLTNNGPSYSYGFGWLDVERAAITLENNRYFNTTISNGIQNVHSVAVPANTVQLKVMLYWNDPPASLLSSRALVNDLDLIVQTPSSTTVFPKILDTVPSNVTGISSEGPDHINNIEQVIINSPQPGSYSIKINGTAVTQNSPQEYFVVYDLVPDSTKITFPIGGEGFSVSDSALLQWSAHGTSATFTLNYTTDGGLNWTTIDNAVAGNVRQKKWNLPAITTDKAKVQVINNLTGSISTSNAFTILGVPVVTLADTLCEGYIKIKWARIAAATDYEVFMLRGTEMLPVAIIDDTTYTFGGLSKDSIYWVAVRARLNGNPGRRSIAISRQPNTGTCLGSISDNDLKVEAILEPVTGRKFTLSELGSSVQIKVRIKNLDDVAISNFDVRYSINGGGWFTENVTTSINGGGTYTHTFSAGYNFSAVGTYLIKAVVDFPLDTIAGNDTLAVVVKQLDNQPINLITLFSENFDATPPQEFTTAQSGLINLDRFDFSNSSVFGRLRSFVNSGMAHSGNRALSLDVDRTIFPSANTNYLTGMFNLSNYDANTTDVRADFYYNNHGQLANPLNTVWIRGSENSSWIPAYDLFANQIDPGNYKKSSSIEVSDLLVSAGQNFTPSFQIRWGQFGYFPATDKQFAGGYTFDDIHLYKVIDDIQMLRVDTPILSSCGLNSTTQIKTSVRNSANTSISSIPVKHSVDGGAAVSEVIPAIPANTTIQYSFLKTANLASIGTHTVRVWVDYPSDSYRENDTIDVTIVNSPVISAFPYLENFESGSGFWYSSGVKNSWQYGTPVSNKINSAASGSKAWKTRLVGNYNDVELSYLYSPCFDVSNMSKPTLSFSLALDIEDCGATLCDGAWVEYSPDGVTWSKLGALGSGTNWYNKNYAGNHLWSVQNYTRWHVATTPLPAGISNLRLRFVMNADPGVNREGVAIDDIHIYDNTMGIYDAVTMASPTTQTITGGGYSWTDFTSGGKLVASIRPNGENLGSTDVQVYINTAAVRIDSNQYYHDRNVTIKPANSNLSDSAVIRFYYLDSECERLINASGCTTCSKPRNAYQIGIAKYNDIDDAFENGTIADNSEGSWTFIPYYQAIIVPFDKGYYSEYKVKNFSEFWLKKEAFNRTSAPPFELGIFKVSKQSNDVLVEWTTITEGNVSRFEVELAKGNSNYQQGNFIKIGEVPGRQNASQPQAYTFSDTETEKAGVRYYRLKVVYRDGSFSYSIIKSVVFSQEIQTRVYPNPSSGTFNFEFQQNEGEILTMKIYNINGQLVKQLQALATGFVQKITIDLKESKYAKGVYVLISEGTSSSPFKILKQ